ncbi:MAG: hypothetical protein JKY65_05005 [Planctomycetes bacterium]|nr:hypothetical protein [Planctomycetota bacterium]
MFSLVLFAGLAARLELGPGIPQNAASSIWIAQTFPPILGAVVSVAILAAGPGGSDGIGLVAWIVALQRPPVVAIFGSVGAYGLICASLPAVLYGVLCKRPPSAGATPD